MRGAVSLQVGSPRSTLRQIPVGANRLGHLHHASEWPIPKERKSGDPPPSAPPVRRPSMINLQRVQRITLLLLLIGAAVATAIALVPRAISRAASLGLL
jgi:hypothetical protein